MIRPRRPLILNLHLSVGERQLLLGYSLVAFVGGVLGIAALSKLQAQPMVQVVSMARGWLALSGAIGAVIALRVLRGHFGREGRIGTINVILAGILAALVAGVVAGTLVLPAYGTMFGPWLMLAAFLSRPILVVPWAAAIYSMHLAHLTYGRERQTLDNFRPRPGGYRL